MENKKHEGMKYPGKHSELTARFGKEHAGKPDHPGFESYGRVKGGHARELAKAHPKKPK